MVPALNPVPDDSDDEEVGGFESDLDRLVADTAAYEAQPIKLLHPLLPGYELWFRSDIEFKEVEAWRKKAILRAARRDRPEEVDAAKASALIVAGSCIGIYRDGTPILDEDGRPVTFSNREFQAKLLPDVAPPLRTAAAAVRKFLIKDPAVGTLANSVVEKNGYGDDAEEAPDPTDTDS